VPLGRVDFENDLNPEQLAAVQAPEGAVLVIAAAGTGKTRTLVYRVAYLVERGVDPRRILLLTFTNRAAAEMLARAEELVGETVGGLWGGTFHHMANRILRRHAGALGYPNDYAILDRDDSRSLIRHCVEELKLEKAHTPKPDVLMSVFGLAASRQVKVETIAGERFDRHPVAIDDMVAVHRRYREKKIELGAMDFDDLLVNGLRLFREHDDILERYRERFLHVLVDEYQDTNRIQAEWVDALAAEHGNLLVVGDDFQSIYSWRGADFRNILNFPQRYTDATLYKLETNYRSVPEILEVANACIAGNPEQYQKNLRAVRKAHHRPRLVYHRNGVAQSRYIIGELARLRAAGYRMQNVAVLYRSHFHAMELQLELARERIPYLITSGARFFEQAHVKDVLSVLRVVSSPGDELAFLRLAQLLPRVGQKTAGKIWAKLDCQFPVLREGARSRFRALLPPPARERWDEIEPIFPGLDPKDETRLMVDVLHEFVEAFYAQYAVETFDNYPRRLEDLEELIAFAARFDTVEALLSEVALATNLDTETDPYAGRAKDMVRLSTVHQAKGLEWNVVFILWLADGMFPSGRSIADDAEQEERRLFYVAATRAKDELFLCVPECRRARDGGAVFYAPSRFVREIPEALLEETAGTF